MSAADASGRLPAAGGLLSMTGYGRGEAQADGILAVAEISSVNRRQLDVRLQLPRFLAPREALFLDRVQRRLHRGHVTATVTIDAAALLDGQPVQWRAARAAAWIAALRAAAAELGLADDLGASDLIRLPGVLPPPEDAVVPPRAQDAALTALDQALDGLCAMRGQEGARLRADLDERLHRLHGILDAIAERAPSVSEAYRETLRRRLADAGHDDGLEDEAMRRELLLFATRSDITEEITRLRSHFEQAAGFLQSVEPAGRALDFLVQEMGREINTLGAKAADATVSRHAVTFKTELERFREQVQNVE